MANFKIGSFKVYGGNVSFVGRDQNNPNTGDDEGEY
jgi:hypothetical protein